MNEEEKKIKTDADVATQLNIGFSRSHETDRDLRNIVTVELKWQARINVNPGIPSLPDSVEHLACILSLH